MSFRPLYDRIAVKRIEERESTRNGLFIPDSAKEKPHPGEVIAVGHGKMLKSGELMALDVKVGDRVFFGRYSGTETKLIGTECIIMREDEVLGIIESAADTEYVTTQVGKNKYPCPNRSFTATVPARPFYAA
jgi:chaperonin GroES